MTQYNSILYTLKMDWSGSVINWTINGSGLVNFSLPLIVLSAAAAQTFAHKEADVSDPAGCGQGGRLAVWVGRGHPSPHCWTLWQGATMFSASLVTKGNHNWRSCTLCVCMCISGQRDPHRSCLHHSQFAEDSNWCGRRRSICYETDFLHGHYQTGAAAAHTW